jgi:hypothetical protein
VTRKRCTGGGRGTTCAEAAGGTDGHVTFLIQPGERGSISKPTCFSPNKIPVHHSILPSVKILYSNVVLRPARSANSFSS